MPRIPMKTHIHDKVLAYDGAAIRPHWARRVFGIAGDSAVSFRGPCDVNPSEVQDMEEVISGDEIRSSDMVHFIVEHFGPDLDSAVLRSRLLAALAFESLRNSAGDGLSRRGDDLYLGVRKMSVCVATVTPVSVKIHFGVNVTGKGAPVDAAGLEDVGADPWEFAVKLLASYESEMRGCRDARCKSRGVGP